MNNKHYNAFISYRHAEKDSKIASEIQRQLERCHIPRAIKKQYGINKITRIFRDKEELPITSNLNDNISNALENSDYLIVICSTSTKESLWVPREIEYFLRNHTKKEVLTVLVDGEPKDVIPPILLGERVIKADEDGNMTYEDIPIEPLSCDYRMPIKRARKEELPRLAATIIGCTYDELVRRQRQYKLKRFTSIMTAALILAGIAIGYLTWSTIKIQQNYDESLRSQSRYLSKESLSLLDNEQRIKAIQLALAALPTEDDPDRPYTPEAEYALSRSIMAYTPLLSSNISSVWNYQCTSTVKDFKVSPEATTVSAYDATQTVYIWDAQTHETIQKINVPGSLYDIKYYDDDTLLVAASSKLIAINAKTGDVIWSDEDVKYTVTKIVISGDKVLVDDRNYIYEVAVSDGSIVEEHPLPVLEDGSVIDIFSIYAFNDGTDNKIFMVASSPDNYSTYITCFYDLNTDDYLVSYDEHYYIDSANFIDSSTVAFMEDDESMMDSSYSVYDMKQLNASVTHVTLMDINSMQVIWSTPLEYTQVSWNNDLLHYTFIDPDNVSFDAIIAYAGNIANVYSVSDGRILTSYDLNVPIIAIYDNEDGTVQFVTNDGYSGYSNKNKLASAYIMKHFTDGIDKIVLNKGGYIHKKNSSEIILYSSNVFDEDLEIISDKPYDFLYDYYMGEHYLTTLVTNADDTLSLRIYDLDNKTTAYEVELNPEIRNYDYAILGEEDNIITVAGLMDIGEISYYNLDLITVDMNTLTHTEDTLEKANITDMDNITYNNGLIYLGYNNYSENKKYLEIVDPKAYTADTIEIGTYDGYFSHEPIISKSGNYALIYTSDYTTDYSSVLFVDIANKTAKELYTDITPYSSVAFDKDEKYIAIGSDNKVYLYDTTGTLLWELDNNGLMAYDVYIDNGELYVLFSGGVLNRYDLEDGTFLSQTDIMISSNVLYSTPSWYMDNDANLLYITYGKVTSIVNTDSWILTSFVNNSLGYNPANDIFCTSTFNEEDYGDYYIAYFKHYTLQDLIEKANEITKHTALTEEERSFYGLSKH